MPRVLVVDDEEALCWVLKDVLELEGYEVEMCHDITTAKNKLSDLPYDAALVDIYLTNEPLGLELVKHINEDYPGTKPIFMTGYAEDENIFAGYSFGTYTCIRKPYDLEDVIRVVGMVIDG